MSSVCTSGAWLGTTTFSEMNTTPASANTFIGTGPEMFGAPTLPVETMRLNRAVYNFPMPRVLLNFQLYGNLWSVHFHRGRLPDLIGSKTRYYPASQRRMVCGHS